jgi:hypothetical protein
MFSDPHLPNELERSLRLRPDRRPLPRANEIRLRIKRAVSRGEA